MKKVKIAFGFFLIIGISMFVACESDTAEPTSKPPEEVVKKKPIISELLPLKATVGEVLVIKGENLSEVDFVRFNSNTTSAPTEKTSLELKVVVPSLAEGNYSVTVEASAGNSNAKPFELVVPKPPLINKSEFRGLFGNYIVITGTNMQKVTKILLGDKELSPKTTSETEVTFLVPIYNAEVHLEIKVENDAGLSNPASVHAVAPPKVNLRVPNEPYAGLQFIIKGQSLSMITQIGFSDGNWTSNKDFISSNNEEIIFEIPKTVKSGKQRLNLRTEFGDAIQEVVVASFGNNQSLNPGNIAVNPGVIASIGIVNDACERIYLYSYIDGVCWELSGGTRRKTGQDGCSQSLGAYYREINNVLYRVYNNYNYGGGNNSGREIIELLYETLPDFGGYTGRVMLAKVSEDNVITITHRGKVLTEDAFDKNKYSSSATLLSVNDGSVIKICSPNLNGIKVESQFYGQQEIKYDNTGVFQNGIGEKLLSCELISKICPVCNTCQ